ncbi:M20/M25/M40 family metallo-hydrolase [Jatrophihabitans sp.]|uniref:M20/M25/M40 family metallo-hydrolase n=1 Tax=Jatrophihabitans sp. TaxID=1932789 RepID=UPI002CA403AD|nr:M20/M25/M40 family metallo-hydrolase [Jatrophihabitans sp.]
MTPTTDPRTQDAVALTADLVGIDSVNPSLVPGAAGEHAIAEFVRDWAAGCGLDSRTVFGPDGRPSVLVRGGAGRHGRTLLLCGHLDTVGHGTMRDPLAATRDGGRLHGRGSYDMKAGLAAALVACREAAAAGIGGQVLVAAVADEEHSSTGVQAVLNWLRAEQIVPDAAVVTEPTETDVAVAHKGFVWTEIEVIGRAAHGSRPQLGIDAISRMGPVLVALDRFDRELARRPPHPLLGSSSLHASLISGGAEASTIPELCTLTVERRTLPGQTVGEVEADIARLLDRCAADQPDLVTRTRTLLARQPLQTRADEPIVTMLTEVASRIDGRPRTPSGLSYWADSAFLAAAGIPTVLFGPRGEGAHAEVEWVEIASVHACAEVLTALARDFSA